MCGRFALAVPRRLVAEAMGVPDMPDVPPRPEIFPSQLIEAVFTARESGRRMAGLFRWGFVPAFLKDDAVARPMINARSETVLTLPSFRAAARYRRCLIPAQGYYEWRKEADGRKTRFYCSLPGSPVLALAGIYERAVTAQGEVRDTVAILTRTALGAAAAIHPRMPLIIAVGTMAAWLDPGRTERTDIEPLLSLPPPQGLKASSGPGQPTQLVL
ncbi:SOS response-associated peptidase [Desulfovibrio aerotolerans]|uniref:Abasic site processing protein n=1 Tax=Solidesulfovibrio aerotolerans TaxID=295255 RepID=A0A7C9N208_9BACT|nr:SOS response-associated peptidase [Solidesulfovibrio aerotolerans]MYL84437.1 SOS response-associated peptidase [Solidesulfovibrio aerotolerans]